MGCKNTNANNEELFNENVDIKRRFLTGIHISKGTERIEGNVQIALGTTRKKKYERVTGPENIAQTPSEETEGNVENTLEST